MSSPMAPPMLPDPMKPIFIGFVVCGGLWAPRVITATARAAPRSPPPRMESEVGFVMGPILVQRARRVTTVGYNVGWTAPTIGSNIRPGRLHSHRTPLQHKTDDHH